MDSAHRSPSDSQPPPPGVGDDLKAVWSHFRAGHTVFCPEDRAPLALAVDAATGTYRFVCTECGASSPWFECGPNGLRVRGALMGPRQHDA
jgi:hypothetical protein